MTELTKEIAEKYSKVYYEIENYFKNKYWVENLYKWKNKVDIIPFEIFYSILEKFFDDNGIEIFIEPFRFIDINDGCKYNHYGYAIYQENNKKIDNNLSNELCNKTRQEAQRQAILKACEIYNKTLEDRL